MVEVEQQCKIEGDFAVVTTIEKFKTIPEKEGVKSEWDLKKDFLKFQLEKSKKDLANMKKASKKIRMDPEYIKFKECFKELQREGQLQQVTPEGAKAQTKSKEDEVEELEKAVKLFGGAKSV